MPTFLELNMSTRKDKKMVFKMENPKRTIHFGSKTSRTYVEGASKEDRLNYIKRHKVRENWDEINAGSLSRFLLWGDSVLLSENLKKYLKRFNLKVRGVS